MTIDKVQICYHSFHSASYCYLLFMNWQLTCLIDHQSKTDTTNLLHKTTKPGQVTFLFMLLYRLYCTPQKVCYLFCSYLWAGHVVLEDSTIKSLFIYTVMVDHQRSACSLKCWYEMVLLFYFLWQIFHDPRLAKIWFIVDILFFLLRKLSTRIFLLGETALDYEPIVFFLFDLLKGLPSIVFLIV